jgi:alkylated DNA repair protein (DNA oxidative demethylase)
VNILRGFALAREKALLDGVAQIADQAPFRHLTTPGGHRMSVAMTNCGPLGWVSDRSGYRYDPHDPDSGRPWPAMPSSFVELAIGAAAAVGYPSFMPDACLINRYQPGARLSLHRDEGDFGAPIVSVSLGADAIFLFGGLKRTDRAERVLLRHGDVVVLGGEARMRYHGVAPLKAGGHRINLTFRKASSGAARER